MQQCICLGADRPMRYGPRHGIAAVATLRHQSLLLAGAAKRDYLGQSHGMAYLVMYSLLLLCIHTAGRRSTNIPMAAVESLAVSGPNPDSD